MLERFRWRCKRQQARQAGSSSCLAALLLLLLLPPWVWSQARGDRSAQGEIRREFYDPNLGSHWRLIVDSRHPERPGRLVLLSEAGTASPDSDSGRSAPPLAIHAGDRVTVDQETPVLHSRLQAVALDSVPLGRPLRLRLSAGADSQQGISGKVIRAIATGPQQAEWLSEGSRP